MSVMLHITLTNELSEQLEAFSKAQGVPPVTAVIVREALVEYLDKRGFPVSDVHPKRGGDRSK